MSEIPTILLEGVLNSQERAARIARYEILMELGYFGIRTTIRLAKGEYAGYFTHGVRQEFADIYQTSEGCTAQDIEAAAEYLSIVNDQDYLSDVYDYELRNNGTA